MITEKINNFSLERIMIFVEKIGEKWWGMLLLISLPIFLIFSPVLVGGRVFFNGDLINYHYSIYNFYQQAIQTGESILWNSYNFSGFPTFVGATGGFFSPLNYLAFKFFPFLDAYHWIIFLNLVLGGFFTALLLKKIQVPFWGALIGGITYVFGQWFLIVDITIANAVPILPLLFLLLWRVGKEKDNWLILWGGLVIGWAWLSVNYSWMPIILTAVGIFSLYLGWQAEGASFRKYFKIPAAFLMMVIVGTAIGLIQLAPAFIYTSFSSRTAGLSFQEAAVGALGPVDFIHFLLPYFRPPFFSEPEQLYIGILPLFFLLVALLNRSYLVRFFSFLFLGTLFASIKYSPLFWLIHQSPGFQYFRGPTRWMFVGYFAAAMLAGFGIQQFIEEEKTRWKNILLELFKWFGVVIVGFSAIASFIFLFFECKILLFLKTYFDKYFYSKTSGLPIEYYHNFIEKLFFETKELINPFNMKFLFPMLFLIISYFMLRYFYQGRQDKRIFLQLAALVIILNFAAVFSFAHQTFSREAFLSEPGTVHFLKTQPPGRIFSFLPGYTEFTKLTAPHRPGPKDAFVFTSEMLPPNINLLYQLESADYYDNFMSVKLSRLLALLGSDRAVAGEKLAGLKLTPKEKVQLFEKRKELADFLGIRYIISAFPFDEDIFPKIFEIVVPPHNTPLAIYENKKARSLFYFADRVETVLPDEKNIDKMVNGSLGERGVFIECAENCPEKIPFPGKSTISLQLKNNSSLRLLTESETDAMLIFSQNYLPGWRAYRDGKEVPIYTVNGVYMGVFVPAGNYDISFQYSYWSLFNQN